MSSISGAGQTNLALENSPKSNAPAGDNSVLAEYTKSRSYQVLVHGTAHKQLAQKDPQAYYDQQVRIRAQMQQMQREQEAWRRVRAWKLG